MRWSGPVRIVAAPCARLQFVRGPVRKGGGVRPLNSVVRPKQKLMESAVRDETVERSVPSAEPLRTVSSSPQQSSFPRDAAAQLPWPSQVPPQFGLWDEFAPYPNFWQGHITCG